MRNPYSVSVTRSTAPAYGWSCCRTKRWTTSAMTGMSLRNMFLPWLNNSSIYKRSETTRRPESSPAHGRWRRPAILQWLDLDLDSIRECRYIKVRFGRLPKDSYEKLNHYHQNPYVIFFPCTSDDIQYWGVYFSPIEMVSEVDRIFSSLYFERVRLAELHSTPEHVVEALREERAKEIERIKAVDAKNWRTLEKRAQGGPRRYTPTSTSNPFISPSATMRRGYHDNFILTGWIPAEKEESFCRELDKLTSVDYTLDKAENELEHSPPVQLKNKKLIRPFEFFVDMFGLPQYDELDPTPFVAITYVLLFGIMFGDVGQGLACRLWAR